MNGVAISAYLHIVIINIQDNICGGVRRMRDISYKNATVNSWDARGCAECVY